MLEKQEEGKNSQFLEGCNTDWNLDMEFLHWLRYWMKEYLKNAGKIVDLEFHKYNYNGETLTQKQIIERIIELCNKYLDNECCINEDFETVDEIFDLFHLVFWNMWW